MENCAKIQVLVLLVMFVTYICIIDGTSKFNLCYYQVY